MNILKKIIRIYRKKSFKLHEIILGTTGLGHDHEYEDEDEEGKLHCWICNQSTTVKELQEGTAFKPYTISEPEIKDGVLTVKIDGTEFSEDEEVQTTYFGKVGKATLLVHHDTVSGTVYCKLWDKFYTSIPLDEFDYIKKL